MMNNIIEKLAKQGIHSYGSEALLKFEKQMEKYFTREYERWRGNEKTPKDYGLCTFTGNIANKSTDHESIEHYNKSLKIYQAFLDSEYMAYTMAYYQATDETPSIEANISLSHAQKNKFNLVIERADIKDGQSILELGCGFGGFSRYLLDRFPNIKITGINPSHVQSKYLRIAMRDYNRFTLVQKQFDEISTSDLIFGQYDRVVSIGVMEAVTNFDKLFLLMSNLLKPGGKMFHHFIVSQDTIPQFLEAESTLMADYFPGGHIFPFHELERHNIHLNFIDSWFVNGMNYWKTLDEWHKNFWSNIDLLHPSILSANEVSDWNKYFILCKTMFKPNSGKSYGNGHYLFQKK